MLERCQASWIWGKTGDDYIWLSGHPAATCFVATPHVKRSCQRSPWQQNRQSSLSVAHQAWTVIAAGRGFLPGGPGTFCSPGCEVWLQPLT